MMHSTHPNAGITTMNAFPVTRIIRPFLGRDEPLHIHCSMIEHTSVEGALAATPLELGDKVEFAWWAVPNYDDFRLPEGSLFP
jgi:hypothetical protein